MHCVATGGERWAPASEEVYTASVLSRCDSRSAACYTIVLCLAGKTTTLWFIILPPPMPDPFIIGCLTFSVHSGISLAHHCSNGKRILILKELRKEESRSLRNKH